MVYGAIRDVNPLWRGRELVRQGQFEAARQSFLELGPQGEARAWVAFCYLAEGHFDKGLDVLREPEVAQYLPASFRPHEFPLESAGEDAESPALLPRGLISVLRPNFVFRPAPAGTLALQITISALGIDSRVGALARGGHHRRVLRHPLPRRRPSWRRYRGLDRAGDESTGLFTSCRASSEAARGPGRLT
jgi:hypothetical protein